MSKEQNQFEVPFQVQTLIETLKNKQERVHIRGNYRRRLASIKQVIDEALIDYDREMGDAPPRLHFPKGKR
jgi:hypothetical protein